VAVWLMPVGAPDILGVSHWFALAACIALLWLVAVGSAADPPSAPEHDGLLARFSLSWSVVVSLAYLVGLAHLWARSWVGWGTACLASVGLLVALAVYRASYRPVRALSEWLSAKLPASTLTRFRCAPPLMMVGFLLLWAVGWLGGLQTRSRAAAAGMNIIVIAVDTLRWDGVSLLSPDEHDRDCTPNLRRLLTPRSTVFLNAYSQAPWTLPAFASIFTGLYPEQHGAEHVWSRLQPHHITLAELLREHGYLTMAVTSGYYVTSEVGMTQGFTMYDEGLALDGPPVTSEQVTDRALRFLETGSSQPFFLFVHYFDPHYPYLSHREVDVEAATGDQVAVSDSEEKPSAGTRPDGRGRAAPSLSRLHYDEEVAYVDLHIGRLLAFLDERQLWDNTCVVFVSDHGEEFMEHGGTGHDNTLFQELVRVPLSLAAPSLDLPDVISEPVEIRWLFGTLLELAGLRSSSDAGEDPSLLARGSGERYARSSTCPRGRTGVEGSTKPSVWLSSLSGERYKLIEDHLRGRTMLFDLLEDSGELQDLSRERPEVSERLRRALAASDAELQETDYGRPTPQMSDRELRRIKSLGYL
jgi:arylsulfatase A-like enzyme